MQMQALADHWLPSFKHTPRTLAKAMWLQEQHWENTSTAIANGIGKAFKGQ